MNDLNLRNFAPDGGTVAFTGQSKIPAGAFEYAGPCPDIGHRHVYRWTAKAVDAYGRLLATATVTATFPPAAP